MCEYAIEYERVCGHLDPVDPNGLDLPGVLVLILVQVGHCVCVSVSVSEGVCVCVSVCE